jgi:hypothetical protein
VIKEVNYRCFRNSSFHTKPSRVRRKAWKPNKKARRMVLGSDVGLEESCRLALCGLVGRLSYPHLADSSVQGWITQFWAPLLGYEPEMLCLTKGWFGFICKTPEDAELLLNSFWVIGRSTLMLKRWRVAFDPRTEYFHYRHLWVLLSGLLPLHLWNEGAMRAIGDALGRYITLDSSTLENTVRKVGRVLVEIDIHGGLLEELVIEWRGRQFYRGWTIWAFLSGAVGADKQVI